MRVLSFFLSLSWAFLSGCFSTGEQTPSPTLTEELQRLSLEVQGLRQRLDKNEKELQHLQGILIPQIAQILQGHRRSQQQLEGSLQRSQKDWKALQLKQEEAPGATPGPPSPAQPSSESSPVP